MVENIPPDDWPQMLVTIWGITIDGGFLLKTFLNFLSKSGKPTVIFKVIVRTVCSASTLFWIKKIWYAIFIYKPSKKMKPSTCFLLLSLLTPFFLLIHIACLSLNYSRYLPDLLRLVNRFVWILFGLCAPMSIKLFSADCILTLSVWKLAAKTLRSPLTPSAVSICHMTLALKAVAQLRSSMEQIRPCGWHSKFKWLMCWWKKITHTHRHTHWGCIVDIINKHGNYSNILCSLQLDTTHCRNTALQCRFQYQIAIINFNSQNPKKYTVILQICNVLSQ